MAKTSDVRGQYTRETSTVNGSDAVDGVLTSDTFQMRYKQNADLRVFWQFGDTDGHFADALVQGNVLGLQAFGRKSYGGVDHDELIWSDSVCKTAGSFRIKDEGLDMYDSFYVTFDHSAIDLGSGLQTTDITIGNFVAGQARQRPVGSLLEPYDGRITSVTGMSVAGTAITNLVATYFGAGTRRNGPDTKFYTRLSGDGLDGTRTFLILDELNNDGDGFEDASIWLTSSFISGFGSSSDGAPIILTVTLVGAPTVGGYSDDFIVEVVTPYRR